jgi:hypothetical protein
MKLPEQRIRLVAADPIVVGSRRLLPSVLVSTLTHRTSDQGRFHLVRMRPVSVVVEDEETAKWLEIPNATSNILSTMTAAAIAITVVSALVILIARYVDRQEGS